MVCCWIERLRFWKGWQEICPGGDFGEMGIATSFVEEKGAKDGWAFDDLRTYLDEMG